MLTELRNEWGETVRIDPQEVATIMESRRGDGTAVVILKNGRDVRIHQGYVASLLHAMSQASAGGAE